MAVAQGLNQLAILARFEIMLCPILICRTKLIQTLSLAKTGHFATAGEEKTEKIDTAQHLN